MSHYVQTVRYLSQKLACLRRHTENRGKGFLGGGVGEMEGLWEGKGRGRGRDGGFIHINVHHPIMELSHCR